MNAGCCPVLTSIDSVPSGEHVGELHEIGFNTIPMPIQDKIAAAKKMSELLTTIFANGRLPSALQDHC